MIGIRKPIKFETFLVVAFAVMTLLMTPKNAFADPDLPGPGPNLELIPAGSLVIPMDNDKQNLVGLFNLKAYGLVNSLLWDSIPIKWAIRAGKGKDGIDFTADAIRIFPSALGAATLDFRAGPFIIHKDYADLAKTRIAAFGNQVAVYELTQDVTVDVRHQITQRRKVGVLDDGGYAAIHEAMLNAAGFVAGVHYVTIPATTLATVNANSCFTSVSEPHWNNGSIDPEAQAVRTFVTAGGNFLAQCVALLSYENNVNFGLFQTTNGIIENNLSEGFLYGNPDLPFNQFQGGLSDEGGSVRDFSLAPGSNFRANAHYYVQDTPSIDTYVATGTKLNASGTGSMVFYLGGHDYGSASLGEINGQRMYLNSVMIPSIRPQSCGFDFSVANVTIIESGGSTDVTEGGATDSYDLVLDTQPTADVDITVSPDGETDLGAGAGNPVVLTFTTLNWDTPQPVTVTAVDDAMFEGPHTSTITHLSASADTIYDGIGIASVVANITDNDVQPEVNFTAAAQSGAENVGTMTITAQLSAISGLDVTVPFSVGGTATDPADYTITASPITIPAGSLSADITITVVDDAINESSETVVVTMGVPTNATAGVTNVHTATITDNDAVPEVNWTAASQSGPESAGTITVTTQLSAISGLDVTVPYSVGGTATDPADYTITVSPITIPAGSLSANITITVVDDVLNEGNETVVVTMGVPTNATAGATNVHTATITDNDGVPEVNFTVASQSGPESVNTMMVTVQLSSVSGLDVTVPFSVGGTASDPADYTITASPITIPAGSLTANITITVIDDALDENDETVIVTMGVPTNVTAGPIDVHTATIVDNDTAGVTIDLIDGSVDVDETGPTNDTYTVVLDTQPANDVTMTVSPDGQTTVNPVSLTFTSANWNVAQTVTVTAVDDAVVEGPHTSTISHTAVSADPNYDGIAIINVTANITDDDGVDPNNCIVTVNPPVLNADGIAYSTITVMLRNGNGLPLSGKTVSITSDRGGTDSITQPAAPTDVNGVATGTIRSNTIGAATITATDSTDGVVLTAQPQVFFSQSAVLLVDKRASKEEVVVG
ncbi:MAG: hypothetical protein GTO40_20050, partial [Deltaproteobacteria bacterium]|nr:hypothetical protein [Deltaproteobacteria bacterium]